MNLRCARVRFCSRLAWILAALVVAGCNDLPGRPAKGPEVIRPDELLDFNTLFKQNCSGCHGPDGKGGAAIALDDPVYLAIADDNTIRRIASKGVKGTPMTPFAQSAGGMLTEKQIEVLAQGIRAWARPNQFVGVSLPPYETESPGDAQRGAQVYGTFCSSCHGPQGEGGEKGSSIVNGSYLALVSNQQLRTIVIAGRPDLGAPDWRGNVPGRTMTAQEISDVVSWLAAQRPQFSGQPYRNSDEVRR
jgi:cytochrome c oxidase cbb3-type subunit 3